jgi:hypothetical protein
MKKKLCLLILFFLGICTLSFALYRGWLKPPVFPSSSGGPGTAISRDLSNQFQSLSWIGILEKFENPPLSQVVIRHNLSSEHFTPTEEWVTLRPPLNITLWDGAGHSEKVTATEFTYQQGCDSYPTFKLLGSVPAGDWKFAVPQNESSSWTTEDRPGLKVVSVSQNELSNISWDKLSLNLAHIMNSQTADPGHFFPMSEGDFPELTKMTSDEVLQILHKNSQRKLSALQTNDKNTLLFTLLFADLEMPYKGFDREGKEMEFTFRLHRMYQLNASGEFEMVSPPQSGNFFWMDSYRPTEAALFNTKTQSILLQALSDDPYRSLYLLISPQGSLEKHDFTFGREDCE